jgi:5-methylthioadenosine/S-adenosylhomocysteine deaminase
MPKSICISGGHILASDSEPLREGGLLIDGDRIAAILTPSEATDVALYADEVVDATGMLLMPPLFDAHVHSTSTLARGTENSLPLELWSYYAIAYGRGLTEETIKHAVMLTNVEMIRNGIGGYIDHFPHTRFAMAGMDAHIRSGLRVGLAPFFADQYDEDILGLPLDRDRLRTIAPQRSFDPKAVYAIFDELVDSRNKLSTDRITLLAGPNSPQRCSDAAWSLWRSLQSDFDLGSHTHLLETIPQASAAKKRWPQGVVQALDDAGLLHEKLSVGHGIWLSDAEKMLLAKRGVTVSFNPISNAMLGSGRKNARHELDLGVSIALGTDCSNTGGRHDLFEVMRHMFVSGRDAGSDFERWLTPVEVLAAATKSGARALCSSVKTGTLEKGNGADVLLLDFDAGGMTAAPYTPNSIVVHADPRNVCSLMVDGRWLLRDRVIVAFDENEIVSAAKISARNLRESGGEILELIESLHGPYGRWQETAINYCNCPACGNPNLGQAIRP